MYYKNNRLQILSIPVFNNSRHSNHLLTINYMINKKFMECVGKRIDYCPLNRQLSMSVSASDVILILDFRKENCMIYMWCGLFK